MRSLRLDLDEYEISKIGFSQTHLYDLYPYYLILDPYYLILDPY